MLRGWVESLFALRRIAAAAQTPAVSCAKTPASYLAPSASAKAVSAVQPRAHLEPFKTQATEPAVRQLADSGLLAAPQLGGPASSDGGAGFWVALRTQQERPSC